MMPIIDKTATRENIPTGNTLGKGAILDFTVPVIDNFGDMGFALSLAVSLLEKMPSTRVRFFSENRELFGKMVGNSKSERLEYHELSTWTEVEHSEIRLNFFGYKIHESDMDGRSFPRKVLNFDYLQFHRHGGATDPGIASIHGMRYPAGSMEVVHLVPSPLTEGGGVVVPSDTKSHSKDSYAESFGLPSEITTSKWCSVFTYPKALERILEVAPEYPEWTFLLCGNISGNLPKNAVSIPFLSLSGYSSLLHTCDTNIVRGENSLIGAMLAGKPFLWDIYRESNGAHEEKIRDLGAWVNAFVPWDETLLKFTDTTGFDRSLEILLLAPPAEFKTLGAHLHDHDIAMRVISELLSPA